jgi:hypothetical protein
MQEDYGPEFEAALLAIADEEADEIEGEFRELDPPKKKRSKGQGNVGVGRGWGGGRPKKVIPEPVKRGVGRPKGRSGGKANTEEKKGEAKRLFLLNKDIGEIQKKTGLSMPTIRNVVRELSIDSPEKIGRFTKAKRITAIDDLVDLMYETMKPVDKDGDPIRVTAADVRNLSITLGVLIDKRRLEEGLSTANTDSHLTVQKTVAWTRRTIPALLTAGKK